MTKKKRELIIKKTFESNRLSESHLADAYEVLIPTIKHVIKTGEDSAEKQVIISDNKRIGENKS